MGFLTAIKTCLQKFVVFQGRASRKEFWSFVLFGVLIQVLVLLFDGLVLGMVAGEKFTQLDASGKIELYGWRVHDFTSNPDIAFLVLLLPTLAAGVRRLHDVGRSGFWILIVAATPICGMLVMALFSAINQQDLGNLVGLVSLLLTVIGIFTILFWWVQPSAGGPNGFDLAPPARHVRSEPRLR